MTTQHPLFSQRTEKNVTNAMNALYAYFEKQKQSESDNVLWDDEQDVNIVIEPKVSSLKADTFNSIRIPLAHSFRKDTDSDICVITRTKDVSKWTEVLLTTFPVAGVTKIMSVSEFESDYKTQEARHELSQLFDLFIVHPSIIYRIASKLIPFLRNRNKACAVLPMAFSLLQLGDTNNPLHIRRYETMNANKMEKYSLKLAKMVAKYRDSTYFMNFNLRQKFVKIGISTMKKGVLKDNLWSVLKYGLSIMPNGGMDNVLRLSLHLNNTQIQLPFYVNLDSLSDHFDIVNPKQLEYGKGKNEFAKKRKQIKMKEAMKKNCNKLLKNKLIQTVSVERLAKLKYVTQCMIDK